MAAKKLRDIIAKIAHSRGDEKFIKDHQSNRNAVSFKNDKPTENDKQFSVDITTTDYPTAPQNADSVNESKKCDKEDKKESKAKEKKEKRKERLDELSKKLVGRYINKSHWNGGMADFISGAESGMAKVKKTNAFQSKKKADAEKTSAKREKGIGVAVKKLTGTARVHAKEEVEPIEELSKKKLGSYIMAADRSKSNISGEVKDIEKHKQNLIDTEYQSRHIDNKDRNVLHGIRSKLDKSKQKLEKKSHNREFGIYRAVKKLAKEEVEPIEELSKATLKSYTSKADKDAKKQSLNLQNKIKKMRTGAVKAEKEDKAYKRIDKRAEGIGMAHRKITGRAKVAAKE